jgi:hypothetical protein
MQTARLEASKNETIALLQLELQRVREQRVVAMAGWSIYHS